MLGSNVQRHSKRWALTRDARDVDDATRVASTNFALLGHRWRVEKFRDRKLGDADWMCQIDVQTGVVTSLDVIFRLLSPGWVPKVGLQSEDFKSA
jgi:hypothetical protein